MKKFISVLLSMILILSTGTTVLAEPGVDILSAPENGDFESEQEAEENSSEQPDDLKQEETFEETEAEDEIDEELDDLGEEELSDSQETLVEEEETLEQEEEEEAEEVEEEEAEDEIEAETLALIPFDVNDYVDYIDLYVPYDLEYDDRYDLSELEGISNEEEYVIYKPEDDDEDGITSHQVINGECGAKDEALLTQTEEGSTEVMASAVGSGTVWLIQADQKEDLDNILSLEGTLVEADADNVDTDAGNLDTEDPDAEDMDTMLPESEEFDPLNSDSIQVIEDANGDGVTVEFDQVTVYRIHVTVNPATLTLMFLTGQSNMEGQCSSSTGYERSASVACDAGTVYSTYAPTTSSNGTNIAGVGETCSADNASEFVAGSLQGNTNMYGGELPYSLNSLTTEGNGKTGPDSGLAYEWNQLTGDKVWVVNTAWSGTNISGWVSSGTYYQRSAAIWEQVLKTFNAEIAAGHYTAGERLVFWLQGETGDRTLAAADYESYFDSMYKSMTWALDPTAFGIIMVRANTGSPTTDDEWEMTGPRIAQYWLGSGDSGYSNVYVVSNANEQWVSGSGVSSYFSSTYPNGFTYPMQGASKSVPSTVSEVHGDIHYSQIGHNENGITAAKGMYAAIYNTTAPTSVTWKDEYGKEISSITFDLEGDITKMVEVVEPIYAAKSVSYDYGNYATYDGTTATLTGNASGDITASYGGNTISTLNIKVMQSTDISGTIGKVTGVYKYNGSWWYVIDGIIQRGYEGVEQNENGWWYINDGKVDFNYTGFAHNSNGWWYCEEGKVKFDKNSVIQDTNKKINGKSDWWYVIDSKVQENFTGLADYSNSNGWWYCEEGKVTFNFNGVEKNKNGWYYIKDSKVDFSYNGFASNSNGEWYIENGEVTFNKNSVIKDTTGAIGSKGTWWYVVGSKVQTGFTGLADYSNENGWWYIENGKVTFTKDTIAKNKNGWYYIKDSKVDFSFTGLADFPNENGWWYIEKGKVTFKKDTIAKNKNGWYYIKDSKVDFSFTGLADFPNENGWWYCQAGKVNFNYNGIAQNKNGWYYIVNSKVDFSYTGRVTVSGRTYSVNNGKVAR